MNTEWNLEVIYKGLQDPAYIADMQELEQLTDRLADVVNKAKEKQADIEQILLVQEAFDLKLSKLHLYLSLRQSTNTEDSDAMAQMSKVMKLYAKAAPSAAVAEKLFAQVEDIDALAAESEVVKEYSFMLKQAKESSKYLLSDETEEIISAMDMTGGSAWSQLQSFLTSMVKVDYNGETVTLSEIRNLAYSPDKAVRKAAYEAELACYEKIENSLAFSLNNIKNQVTFLADKRGYESALDMTLKQSRMKKETLDAMLEAIKEYLPVFRKYLRKKGELLGHKNGLPFYDLFAPLGKNDKTYTTEEAAAYLTTCFEKFTPDMAAMMQEAFEQEWIDFFPHKGKRGGAFCAGVPGMKQSRILTNFDGTFSAIGTLAHELGHAYHNRQIQDNRIMNQSYSMPVAETASTFNETHLAKYALANATKEEKLALLEHDLMEQTQCIVDIYSRYLFETAVFEQSQNKFLMAEDLKAIMLDAQKQAYGEGLDEEALHPYMWACKGHYYSTGRSFYNFPYAFGNLFAVGLYSMFLKEGESFVPKYNAMLKATPVCTIEESGKMVGVDLTDKKFWQDSLSLIAENIEAFCEL